MRQLTSVESEGARLFHETRRSESGCVPRNIHRNKWLRKKKNEMKRNPLWRSASGLGASAAHRRQDNFDAGSGPFLGVDKELALRRWGSREKDAPCKAIAGTRPLGRRTGNPTWPQAAGNCSERFCVVLLWAPWRCSHHGELSAFASLSGASESPPSCSMLCVTPLNCSVFSLFSAER